MYQQFDKVSYVGTKLANEIKGKLGEVVCRLPSGGLVCEFGNDSYIVAESSLRRFIPSPKDEKAELEVIRRRYSDTDLEN